MIPTDQRERLLQFFGGYFHEDWNLDYKTPEQALSAAIGAHEGEREELAQMIRTFVEGHPDDQELERALWEELGCYYLPAANGISVRTWLLGVAARLARATNSE